MNRIVLLLSVWMGLVAVRAECAVPCPASKYTAVFTAPPGCNPPLNSQGESCNIDNPLLGNGDISVAMAGKPEFQRLFLGKTDFYLLTVKEDKCRGCKGFGTLDIAIPALTWASYRVEQKLDVPEAISTFAGTNGTVTMKTWTPYGSPLVVVEMTTDKPVDVALKLNRIVGEGQVSNTGKTDGVWWIESGYTKEQADIPVMITCAMAVRGAKADTFTLMPGKPVTVVLSLRSSFDSPQHAEEALKFARSSRLDRARAKHEAFWREYWSKSSVEVGDPLIERQYYLSYYALACCTGNREFPPGIWGPWVLTSKAGWLGSYHYNYNFEAAFWHLYSGNRLAQTDGYESPPLAAMEKCREYARKFLKCRGVYFPVYSGPKGQMWGGEAGEWIFFGQKSDAAYIVVNIGMRWGMTRDVAYGKRVYPLVLATAEFWEDYLKREPIDAASASAKATADKQGPNGKMRYVIHGDSIHEGSGPDTNSIVSLALVRNVMNVALDMSRELGVDADRREKWQDIRDHLSPFSTQTMNGKTVFRYTEKGAAWWPDNTLGIQHIYPANGIGLGSAPELIQVARNTIDVMQRWFDGNGSSTFFPAAARVGYDPAVLLGKLHEYSGRASANGRMWCGGGGLENNSTVPNTLNEMLLQSHEGILRLFPVWPKDKPARFTNLRAYGAFLVSAEFKDGVVTGVKLVSEKGRPCVVQNPWPGKTVHVTRNKKGDAITKGAYFTLKTAVNETIEFKPAK
ncbi:MAG: hypothetical protein NTV49_07360 [Kiritimatiellaeota bacterium]|nr:hypothetical protein [Kiritimatiellota bacterium]